MATTAAAYGRSFAAFPAHPSARCAPPSRVSLAAASHKPRAPAPGLRVSCRHRRLSVSACSGEADPDQAQGASPAEAIFDIKLPRRSLLVQFTCDNVVKGPSV